MDDSEVVVELKNNREICSQSSFSSSVDACLAKVEDLKPPMLMMKVDPPSPPRPITPQITTEGGGDYPTDFTPPADSKAISISDPSTPKDGGFDPFAPAPDAFLPAPPCHRKYARKSLYAVVRRLNFDDFEDTFAITTNNVYEDDVGTTSDDDEVLFEAVYETLLEAIILEQIKGAAPKILSLADSDGLRTPTSAPRLTGVAETCPLAPVKATRKFRDIDNDLCRKLEF